jgi:hypothetical protein
MSSDWMFKIGDEVKFRLSDERGCVIGRAEYAEAERDVLVRYKAGDGCQRETWAKETALFPVSSVMK